MSETIKKRSGLFIIITTAVLLTFGLWFATSQSGTPAAQAEEPATAAGVESTLLRAGLSPEAMCAAGVDFDTVSMVIAGCAQSAEAIDAGLANLDESVAEARSAYIAARRAAQSGSGEDILPSLRSALDQAVTVRDAAIAAIAVEASAHFTADQRAAINAINDNGRWPVNTELKLHTRSDADWAAIRDALTAKKVADMDGEALDPAFAALLQAECGASDVSDAADNLAEDLVEIQSAWTSAVSGV